jgi:hypothetical protein
VVAPLQCFSGFSGFFGFFCRFFIVFLYRIDEIKAAELCGKTELEEVCMPLGDGNKQKEYQLT